jgi:hypothetical protein
MKNRDHDLTIGDIKLSGSDLGSKLLLNKIKELEEKIEKIEKELLRKRDI